MTKQEMIERTLEQLNHYYPHGLYEWMFKENKSDYKQLIDIENGIDELILRDGSDIELKNLLITFWYIHKKNIEKFNNCKGGDFNYIEVRKQRLEQRSAL